MEKVTFYVATHCGSMVMEFAHVTGYPNVNVLVAGSNPVGVNVHPTFYFMVPLFYIKSFENFILCKIHVPGEKHNTCKHRR